MEYIYKIVILGDTSVGKSSILYRYYHDKFNDNFETTIGASFYSKDIMNIKFQMWDVAGQERYKSLTPMYYRNADIALIIFDITNIETFTKAKYWINELEKYISTPIKNILIGNKYDLIENEKVSYNMIKEYCASNNLNFFYTSAKTNFNINEIFDYVAKFFLKSPKKKLPSSNIELIHHKKNLRCC